MEVSNKGTTIVLIVGIILIIGGYLLYTNIKNGTISFTDNTVTTSKEDNTTKEVKVEPKKEEVIDTYECPEGYYPEEENITSDTICIKLEDPSYGEYYCPEGSYSENSSITAYTACTVRYDTISANTCREGTSDNGTGCVDYSESVNFSEYACKILNMVWDGNACHSVLNYSCPDDYTATGFDTNGRFICTKKITTSSVADPYCNEGTYDSSTNKCILNTNTIKKDIK